MSVLIRLAQLFLVRERFRRVQPQAVAFLSALGVLVGLMVFALVALALLTATMLILSFHGLQALGLDPLAAGGLVAVAVVFLGFALLVAIGRARRAVWHSLDSLISETSALPGEREVHGALTRTAAGVASGVAGVWRAFRQGLKTGKSNSHKKAA